MRTQSAAIRRGIALLVVLTAITASSCTLEPGSPWGWIDADLHISPLEDSGDVTVVDYTVHFDNLQLRAPGSQGTGMTDFDPSDPPPGFTLCHQGHCHTDDGRIVTYEEIEAGAGPGGDGPVNISTRHIDDALQLDEPVHIDETFRIVEEVSLNQAALTIDHIHLEATFERQEETFELDIILSLATRPLETGILYDVGRNAPERQSMELTLDWPGDLFEDLVHLDDAADNAEHGTIEVHTTSNRELADELTDRIAEETTLRWIEEQ